MSRLRVKVPKRNIVPLSVEEVARFWSSFRTSRDLGHRGLDVIRRCSAWTNYARPLPKVS
jgi:hypothetical protein